VQNLIVPDIYASIYLDNTGWKAAHDVYGAGLRHLLCQWHVDKYGINVTTTALCTVVYFYQVMAQQHTITENLVYQTSLKSIKHYASWRVRLMKLFLPY